MRSREETSALTNTSEESLIRKEEQENESWCEFLNIWWKYEKTRGWTMNISWHCVLRCSFLQQQKSFVSPRSLIQHKFPLSSPLFHSRPLSSSTPLFLCSHPLSFLTFLYILSYFFPFFLHISLALTLSPSFSHGFLIFLTFSLSLTSLPSSQPLTFLLSFKQKNYNFLPFSLHLSLDINP